MTEAQDAVRQAREEALQTRIREPWHLRTLRQAERARAASILERQGVLEVVGAPGIGRQTFIREVANEYSAQRRILDPVIEDTRSLDAVCRVLCRRMSDDEEPSLSSESLLAAVLDASATFIIPYYDPSSVPTLRSLLQIRREGKHPEGRQFRSLWVVRSPEGQLCPEQARIHLRPLDDDEIVDVLLRCGPAGNVSTEPSVVARRARGNLGQAIELWRSLEGISPTSDWRGSYPTELAWLDRSEMPLLAVVCDAVKEAPLGATMGLLTHFACAEVPMLPEMEVRKKLLSVLRKLSDRGVVRLDAFDDRRLAEMTGGQRRTGITLVALMASGFAEKVLQTMGPAWIAERRSKLQEYLVEGVSEDYTLAGVTIGLQLQDLRPFFRSSFRRTQLHLALCVEWLEALKERRESWEGRDRTQAYIGRALRLMLRLSRAHGFEVDVDRELGRPSGPNEEYAYEPTLFTPQLTKKG